MIGVFALLKPPAMTSQQAVSQVKRLCGASKVGHAGTLDPDAAGVLPVCIGRATKLSEYLMQLPKTYLAQLSIGIATDTLDSSGTPTEQCCASVDAADIEAVLGSFIGEITQLPPMYSAIKSNGKPLYRYAREGTSVKRQPRTVHVYELSLVEAHPDTYLFRIACSKGTYIRTLLADIARAAGTVGHTSFLLRCQCGGFSLPQSLTLDEVDRACAHGQMTRNLLPPEQAVAHLPSIQLPEHLYPILDSGAAIDLARTHLMPVPNEPHAVFCRGIFFGIGSRKDDYLRLQARIKV